MYRNERRKGTLIDEMHIYLRGSGQAAQGSVQVQRGSSQLVLNADQFAGGTAQMARESMQTARRHAHAQGRQSDRGSLLRREEKRSLHERILFGGQLSEIVSMRKLLQQKENKKPKSRFILSQQIKDDLHAAFTVFDIEKCGVIKSDHLRIALRCLGFEPRLKDLDSLFELVGALSVKELSYADFEYIMRRTMTVKDTDDELRSAFKLLSTEANGEVNLEKLKKVNDLLGESLTDEELKEMIQFADKNKSGTVSEEEFVEFCGETVLWDCKHRE